jgi:hypothetical protein
MGWQGLMDRIKMVVPSIWDHQVYEYFPILFPVLEKGRPE